MKFLARSSYSTFCYPFFGRFVSCLMLSLALTVRLGAVESGSGPAAARATSATMETPAPSSDEETVKLPEFNVSGDAVDPYNGAETTSAARTSSKILDTPLTAYVLTPALIQDINPNVLLDMTNYFAGVSPGRSSGALGFNDRQTFRGFESFGSTVDNFSNLMLPYMYAPFDNFDPLFLDHAELIMGPDSILNPTGAPGGTVSAITKSPKFTAGIDLSAEVGNYDANKISVDATGPLGDGKHMAYRVIASYQDSRLFQQATYLSSAFGAEFTYKFSDTAQLTIKYFGTQQHVGGAGSAAGQDGEMVYTPDTVGGAILSTTPQPGFQYNGWNGDATFSHRMSRDNMAEAELTAALGKRVNMRLAAQVEFYNFTFERGYADPSLIETWNPQTGQENSITSPNFNLSSMPYQGYLWHLTSRQIQVQNDYAGSFKAGAVSLQPIVGWAFQQGSIPVDYTVLDNNMPHVNFSQNGGAYVLPAPSPSAFTTFSNSVPMNAVTMQTYAYLRASFLKDRLFLTGGASRTWADVNEYSVPYLATDSGIVAGNPNGITTDSTFSHTNNALAPSVQPWHDAYIGGVLAKVLPNVSVYYNYSTNNTLASDTPQWQAGVQNEFGIKANFFNNRISITADHFEIKQDNVSYQNPLFNLGLSNILNIYTALANRGEELNIQGGITKSLSVIASYTNQELRDFVGRRQRDTPDNMANLLLDYHFYDGVLKNLDVFVGAIHEAKVPGENVTGFTPLGVPEQPGFYLPAFTIVNCGAGYRFASYRFNLNVDNVLNQHAWWEAASRFSICPYPGATVTLTVTKHI